MPLSSKLVGAKRFSLYAVVAFVTKYRHVFLGLLRGHEERKLFFKMRFFCSLKRWFLPHHLHLDNLLELFRKNILLRYN